jgi:putative aldouronate transport system substrate-binding protein
MDPITHDATSIGMACGNPERALMLIEVLRENEDAHHMLRYGIKDVHYIINADGLREEAPTYDKATMEYLSNAWTIREDKYDIPSVTDWAGRMAMRAERCDPIAKPFLYGRWIFDQDPIEAELTAVQEAYNANLPAIHYGKAGDPAAAVEKLRNDLAAAGIDRLMAEMQRQLDEFKASIGA